MEIDCGRYAHQWILQGVEEEYTLIGNDKGIFT